MSEYDLFARLCDLEHKHLTNDIELYLGYARRCDGTILELGCGSGRVALALARDGLDVVGVDNSQAMLDLARQRARQAGLTGRARFVLGDIRTLEYQDEFAAAFCPLNGFLHLSTSEDQLAALRSAYRALLAGGILILDLPNPHTAFSPDTDDRLYVRSAFETPEGGRVWSLTLSRTDLAEQVQRLTLFYDLLGPDKAVRRTAVEMELRFVYRYEMEALLREAGFALDAVLGSYDMDPYETDSEIMLFVAHKPVGS